jgi:hypothetical protein
MMSDEAMSRDDAEGRWGWYARIAAELDRIREQVRELSDRVRAALD